MNVVSYSQSGGVDHPRKRSAALSQPSCPSIWFHTRTPATNGTTYGRKNRVRIRLEPNRYLLLSPRATAKGTITDTGSQIAANLKVIPSVSQTLPSFASLA